MRLSALCSVLALLLLTPLARAAETETQYLSGHGKDDTVEWEFRSDKGQHAGTWSTIGVPSNWELQGFGIYTYGRVKPQDGWQRVHGTYKRRFTVPAAWGQKTAFLNFEGVMTDTAVTINGQSAGPVHQGGYYAFRYDITRLLNRSASRMKFRLMSTTNRKTSPSTARSAVATSGIMAVSSGLSFSRLFRRPLWTAWQ